ncbi:penicillin acylase family protein [Bacterioplanoides sp. SCSIO 12839]|uniref:penicillin acylase family protein n=1 Tax=Bacterioplanoides sp. SCSIO 12839 TaxID=2829569 RepID=UPI00210790F1|nr:penicillin acylase family protein [Bacterioplanoides sp. SCSIO 12839]UTW47348.1 penicillin acylase family protein [Bacterioplanoides sp. SCSIO 12839]
MALVRVFGKAVGVVSLAMVLSGCDSLFGYLAEKNLDQPGTEVQVIGLQHEVAIRRDDFGVPYIKAETMSDLAFGIGYAMAQDRLAEMTGMNLLARGRLSEMVGPMAVDMDVYMRTLGVTQVIEDRYAALSDELKQHLQHFSDGVNAYIQQHDDNLPLELTLSGYEPAAWHPSNTIGIFVLLNLGVGFNLHEELGFLQFAEQFGWQKAAYLAPIYPDEAIDFPEAKKTAGLFDSQSDAQAMARLNQQIDQLKKVEQQLKAINGQGIAASNNWAVHKTRTKHNASLVANDTHLLLTHPSTWTLMAVESPEYSGVGITLAGVPALVAGYNGHIAWGETMVMADTQDVFIEKLRDNNGVREYLYQDRWYPVEERQEIIKVKGEDDVEFTVQSTRHGPLLNNALAVPSKHAIIPPPLNVEYGLAVSWTAQYPDKTIESFFQLGQAKNIEEIERSLDGVGFIHLNVVYGDKDNIGWQITGNYPLRKQGTGHFPSPGWSGDYDWQGPWGGEHTPRRQNPAQGWLGTGNHRTVDAGFTPTLTSSWYYPERSERIAQLLSTPKLHDYHSMEAMQSDRRDLFLAKVQQRWGDADVSQEVESSLLQLSDQQQQNARFILDRIMEFNGEMQENSANAAIWGALEYSLIRAIFLDEIGPEDAHLWQVFMSVNGRAYSAYQDHVLGREGAPFWDNVKTPQLQEQESDIIVQAAVDAYDYLQQQLGSDSSQWQWGALLTYHWQTNSTKMAKYMSGVQAYAVDKLADYTDRGPYPAGGNRNTLNVAGYDLGSDHNVWNIPAMRMIVDFSKEEPLHLVVAGGQSGNPASPHYDDGIDLWLSQKNRNLPINSDEKVQQHYYPHTLLKVVADE